MWGRCHVGKVPCEEGPAAVWGKCAEYRLPCGAVLAVRVRVRVGGIQARGQQKLR